MSRKSGPVGLQSWRTTFKTPIGWYDPGSGIPYLSTDNRAIAQMAARHLIAHACELLARPELTVKQVARRSGFRTVQYLSAVFREAAGQKPSDYRREKRRGLWF
jgi:hypothetical protein